MTNPHGMEIIIGVKGFKPRPVRFEELKSIKTEIDSIMFLWDFNSYYLSVTDQWFLINGGRRMLCESMGDCTLVYRKRTSQEIAMSGVSIPLREVSWIFGLESVENDRKTMLKISEHGDKWEWINSL